ALSRESRPLPDLDAVRKKIAAAFSPETATPELEAHLRFLGSWPTLRDTYLRELDHCLKHDNVQIVLAGLAVQHRRAALVERNEKLIERWQDNPRIVEQALRNYAFDESADHSATLRRLWVKL